MNWVLQFYLYRIQFPLFLKDTYLDQSSVDKMCFLMIDKNSENNWD